MKKILTYLILFPAFLFTKAQNILPLTSGVNCPGVSTTFLVTMPGGAGSYSSVHAAGTTNTGTPNSEAVQITSDPTVQSSGTQTTFTFTGFFRDVIKPQGLIVSYRNASGVDLSNTFVYTTFTSFNQSEAREKPQTNLTSIQAINCQTQSFNISFANLQYYNAPYPAAGYGSVTSYQYLLPAGWLLGSATSDGVNWLTGTNNVTVTSDPTHGGSIQVRGVPCSPGLSPGPATSISISRPVQTAGYSISGVSPLCSGTTATFTLNGLTAGSSVAWSTLATPAGVVSFGQPNSAQTTVTGGIPYKATLTAQITDACGSSFNLNSPLQVGVLDAPTTMYVNGNAISSSSSVDVQRTTFVSLSIDPVPGASSYFWSIGTNAILNAGQGTNQVDVLIIGSPGNTTSFSVQPVNECGRGGGLIIQGNIVGDVGCDFCTFQASPNPVKSDLYVTIGRSGDSAKNERPVKTLHASLYNFYTNQLVKSWELKTGQKQYHLNVTGVKKGQYVLQIVAGNEKRTKLILID
jgi:hypothetical protein